MNVRFVLCFLQRCAAQVTVVLICCHAECAQCTTAKGVRRKIPILYITVW